MLIAVPAIASALVVSTLSVSLFVTERRDHSPYSLPLPSSIGDFPPGTAMRCERDQAATTH